jgi:hypothetical protein
MITVPNFVENYLTVNGYLNATNTHVIAAENYPNTTSLATYFYRSIGPLPIPTVANPFFNNVMNALAIPNTFTSEIDRLNSFLDKGYRLIDCYDSTFSAYPVNNIIDDLNTLNASKIIFLTENNLATIDNIHNHVSGTPKNMILKKIVPDFTRRKLFFPFPNSYNVENFTTAIRYAINNDLF